MNEGPLHTAYHPRWLRPHTSTYWWLKRRSYLAFILRELSSVFVGWFIVYLLLLVRAISVGEVAYREFLAWSANPFVLILNLVTFLFVVFHAITWFNLAPKAMVVRMGRRDVPALVIAGSNYAAWVVLSALLLWLVLRA